MVNLGTQVATNENEPHIRWFIGGDGAWEARLDCPCGKNVPFRMRGFLAEDDAITASGRMLARHRRTWHVGKGLGR